MSDQRTVFAQPPIGFIVEGACEYNAYPSLVHRLLDASGFHIPRINSCGCSRLLCELKDNLCDLVRLYHPHSVIITVDLTDLVSCGSFADCAEVINHIQETADDWRDYTNGNPVYDPRPARITTVVQIKKFESWLFADVSGIEEVCEGCVTLDQPNMVEDMHEDPATALSKKTDGRIRKNPRVMKRIVSAMDPEVMRKHSSSFDKFAREVILSFETWQRECANCLQ